ncbi:hypothetical protein RUM43_007582 [Polyplax serrata]|uniref:Uncharacterized protein n=1 Tax=Polyplax serrata TaxID=468196 RepID=A0AAN8P5X6_POLSC
MHPIRRRKKRSNYGVRTVEVVRGKNGFGFTISGQQPCILSCIVSGSPAEKAGLRPGDYLVAVNGQSVSKLPHDDVVRLIGCLNGVLKLQIAENYYSDSSDEDNITSVRSKPKFIHKPRNVGTNQRSNGFQTNRTSKLIRDQRFSGTNKFDVNCALPLKSSFDGSWELPELPPPRILHVCNSASNSKEDLSFVIGYLGTIEMPKQIQPGYRLQVVRGCIKKLRTEKRSHAWVLMRVHADGITVAGNGGKILAEYPISRIIYCGTSSDEDKKYFGLVTTGTGDGNEVLPSSSCHVFAVQSNLFEHQKHFAKASAFKIKCTTGTLSQGCFEFPSTSEPILNAIKLFCLTKVEGNIYLNPNELLVANSPQPSHSGSTAASSNSDSGIGFRDECGNQSDRIVMVDVENQRLHIQQLYNSQNLENCQNYLNIQLQPSATEDSQNLQNAFVSDNALCNLPDIMDSKYDARSPDHCTDKSDSKAATSNRSRSPLISSSTSSDDEKSIAKLVCQKNILKNRSTHLTSSKSFEVEASAKSLTDVWYEKSIFYQLGLLPYQTFLGVKPKDMQDVNYKVTSKSSENLDSTVHCHHKVESEECNLAFNKCNSKSIDNLTHKTNSVDLHAKNYLRSPQADIANCTSQMMGSPLSISYGEGSLLQFNGEHKTRVAENDKSLGCDKLDSLPSCCMISSSNFSKDSNNREDATRSKFKSVDNMSVCSYKSNDALLSYKLSPKVFGMKRPLVTQSLEDLKVSETIGNVINYPLSSSVKQQWGSLQDLRSLASVSYDMSLAPEAEVSLFIFFK